MIRLLNRILLVRLSITIAMLSGVLALKASEPDLVERWNNALLDSIRTEDTSPCLAARNLAIFHGALYDASVASQANGRPFFYNHHVEKELPLLPALNSAARYIAGQLHPSRVGKFDEVYSQIRKGIPEADDNSAAERLGAEIGKAWIDWRSDDGHSTTVPYIPKTEPGAWRRTMPFFRPPDLPAWCFVTPFSMVSGAQFRPPGPPRLDSPKFAEDYNELVKWGGINSTSRTPEQTESAKFWSDFSYTVTPPGHWNQVAQEVSTTAKLSIPEKVRLFAILNIAMADSAIACWEAKYYYNFWRPVTAIRMGDTDNNPNTIPDKNWRPLLNTPAFPEYVSGHSAFSAAAATVLGGFLKSDHYHFTVPSDSLPGQKKSYDSFMACATEISLSRMYGGIHFPSALTDGMEMGRKIGNHVLSNFFTDDVSHQQIVYVSPAEIKPGFWIGLPVQNGQSIQIEQKSTAGSWVLWTNGIASGPIIRWRTDLNLDSSAFRVVSR
jgi:membrane-associated phospholipid phosphatase